MRHLAFSIAIVFLTSPAPAGALYDKEAPDAKVELGINYDLLRQARENGLDLSELLEAAMVAALQAETQAETRAGARGSQPSHEAVIAEAFDALEDIAYAPLQLDASSSPEAIRAVCQSTQERMGELIAQAEMRAALPEPATMEEVAGLNRELERRFGALNSKTKAEATRLRASGKILEARCPELVRQQAAAGQAIKAALGPYGPQGWCKAKMRQPQSDWSMQDASQFAKLCTGAGAN